MKFRAGLLAGVLIATPAFAAVDFDQIRKDVNVMAQIIRSSFEQETRRKGYDVDANYLADQGAVFTINTGRQIAFAIGDDHEFVYHASGEAIPLPPIPDLENVTADIRIGIEALEDFDFGSLGSFDYIFEGSDRLDREVRSALREASREMREVEREMSEYRIQMIHAQSEEERQSLQSEMAELEERLSQVEDRRARIEAEVEATVEKERERRNELRKKAKEAQEEQAERMQAIVLNSLCDYGATLRNLPKGEHVSVILKQSSKPEGRQVYVFDRDDVTDCKGNGESLGDKATRYMF